MSGGSPVDNKEAVKVKIVSIFNTKIESPLPKDTEEVIDPQALYAEFKDRFDGVHTMIMNFYRRESRNRGGNPQLKDVVPGVDTAIHNVNRFMSGLNRKVSELTGKEASKYTVQLHKAREKLKELEKLLESCTPAGVARAHAETQKPVIAKLEQEKMVLDQKLKELKIPAESFVLDKAERLQLGKKTVEMKETLVNALSIDFATNSTYLGGLRKKKEKDRTGSERFTIEFHNKVLAQKGEFDRLTGEKTELERQIKEAEQEYSRRYQDYMRVEEQQNAPIRSFEVKYAEVRRACDALVKGGNCFGEDHSAFQVRLETIGTTTRRDETYPEGTNLLNTLLEDVNKANKNLLVVVKTAADDASKQLAEVTNPVGLDGDPVRKKIVDQAREKIAKCFREPLVPTAVHAAIQRIPEFRIEVEKIANELEQRPTQAITLQRTKLSYGEPLSKIGAKTTGDGQFSYKEINGTPLGASTHLAVPGKEIVVVAGPSTNFKPAELKVNVEIEKDKPKIDWRPPPPVLVNVGLGVKTLNARLLDMRGDAIQEALTYAPTTGTSFPAVGEQTLKAKYAGSPNRVAAAEVEVKIQVLGSVQDLGREAALSGRALKEPTRLSHKELLEKWKNDETEKGLKAQSRKVMSDVKDMTAQELVAYMDKFIGPGGDGEGGGKTTQGSGETLNYIWYLSNGLQVRFKPQAPLRPPQVGTAPMFCIEGKTCNVPNEPTTQDTKDEAVFKLTSSGEPGPYGPKQTLISEGVSTERSSQSHQRYMDAACETTHLFCKPKVEQEIKWTAPPDLTEGDALGDALSPTAQDPSALVFTNASGKTVTKETKPPVGAHVIRVKGKETLRYLASSTFVEVTIHVKKRQKIAWKPEAQLFAGSNLGKAVLNATAEGGAVISYSYFDGTNEVSVQDDFIPPVGKQLEFRARAAGTDLYHAVTEPVSAKIDVVKRTQEVTWTPLKSEIEVGTELGEDILNASVKDNATVSYFYDDGTTLNPINAKSKLPAGIELLLKALVAATDHYEAVVDPIIAKIAVVRKEQEVTWNPTKLELDEGEVLGPEILNATSTSGVDPVYFRGNEAISTTTKLPAGEYDLRAYAEETELFNRSAEQTIKLIVKAKEESK